MRNDFDGPDLLVGEIVAVRTFGLRSDGSLWPVAAADRAWVDGVNEARCALHEVAGAPGCRCGYWAYGSVAALLRSQSAAQNVAAIVHCWGRVTPGTRGIRARYARVEAVWLSPRVSTQLLEKVATRYPGAVLYRDRASMLAQHPLTAMPCYVPDRAIPQITVPRKIVQLLGVAVVLLGVISAGVYRAHPAVHEILRLAQGFFMCAGTVASAHVLTLPRGNLVRAQLLWKVLPTVAALELWLWAPFPPLAAEVALRIPLALLLGRLLVNRTLLHLPTRSRRAPTGAGN